jgi:glutamate racemase
MRLLTTGDLQGLQAAAQRWLGLPPEICEAVPASLQGG